MYEFSLHNRDGNLSRTNACVAVAVVSVSLLQFFHIPYTDISAFSIKHPQCIAHPVAAVCIAIVSAGLVAFFYFGH